jgi:hypothetical protein
MSVHDPEPNIPNDDSGKGLRIIGWLLLLWAGISYVWIPPHLWNTKWMPAVIGTCFVAGLFFVGIGYFVAKRSPSDIELDERAHDLMAATHSGQQNDEPAIGDGPGLYPTERHTA